MKIGEKKVLICNCEATMPLDGKAVARGCGSPDAPVVHTQLCRAQLDAFKRAASDGTPLLVGCTQEAPLFQEAASDIEAEAPVAFVNIRERAGWSDEALDATPKIAALLSEAALDIPPTATVTLKSEGSCLVYGRDERAIEAARKLAGKLDVTVLLTRPEAVIPPRIMDVPVFKGTVVLAKGYLGAFEIVVDDYAPALVSARSELLFQPGRNGVSAQCDVILDLSGETALFPAPEKRDGYLRADPDSPAAVAEALFQAADLTGEFEKPRYVDYKADLCAHSRSRKTGCTRCLDVCPTGAITSAGDTVAIDPHICAGCGSCSSVCPTGAASYSLPPDSTLLERLRVLLGTYRKAGGREATLLVHDGGFGEDLIALMARFGNGLPAATLPFAVNQTSQVGLEFLSAAYAYGAARVVLLVDPKKADEIAGLEAQAHYAEAILSGLGYGQGRTAVLVENDPDKVAAALRAPHPAVPAPEAGSFLAVGTRRANLRLALTHLHQHAPEPVEVVPLPDGAPFGAVHVDAAGCTLCLSCVGACPTHALSDNADRPQLSFNESACVQCGLCRATCPENVITLEPRLDFRPEARGPVVVKDEPPFECIRCGKPFGTQSSISRILEKLAGQHAMFLKPRAVERIKMCADCRVVDQFEEEQPMAAQARPRPRTTEDYLRERELAKQGGSDTEGTS